MLAATDKVNCFSCYFKENIKQKIQIKIHNILHEPQREKTKICIGENKAADQLRSNREPDQHLCFRCTDSNNPSFKSELSSF